MGREIRRVPSDWQHPKDVVGHYIPMLDTTFDEAFHEWAEEYELWKAGNHPDQQKYNPGCPFWEWHGPPPRPGCHRPEFESEPTHYQIYETVSEGTPTSPIFATLGEMKEWLIEQDYSRHAASRFINSGWAPSMIFRPDKGMSGIGIHSLDLID